MNKQLGKLLAAVLLLACLPVGAQGTESSQETIPARGSIFEGTVVNMSIWAEAEGGVPFQEGEYYRLTNAEGEVLIRSADGWSGNMPWKATSIPGYPPSPSVAYSDYYLLEVNVQKTSGRWATTGFSLNDTGDWYNIRGIGISSVELTPEALIITGQDMTYDVIVSQLDRATGEMYAYGDIYIEGSGESQVCFTQLQEETVQVDTQLAPAALRLRDNDGQVDLTAQLAPEEIALVNQAITAPGITTALPPEPESWPLALGIGAGVLAAAAIVLLRWQARRKKRPAPPESAPERPPEADSPDSGGS